MQESSLAESQAARAISPSTPTLKPRQKGHGKKPLLKGANGSAPSSSDPLPLGALRSVKVADIAVVIRTRTVLGDIDGLAHSMSETGLLQPPIVDPQMRLVAGYRRLKAAEKLGWKEIAVRVVDIENPLLATIAEGSQRKALTASEKYAIMEALRALAQDEQWRARVLGGRLDSASGKVRLDEVLARHVGLSRESARKIRLIHSAAEQFPERHGDIRAALDEDGRVDRHFRELERRQRLGEAEQVAAIVVRPGWSPPQDPKAAREALASARGAILSLPSGLGTLLLIPCALGDLAYAASLLRFCTAEWRCTLPGNGSEGESAWLVGQFGRGSRIEVGFEARIASSCGEGLDAIVRTIEAASQGAVEDLALELASAGPTEA